MGPATLESSCPNSMLQAVIVSVSSIQNIVMVTLLLQFMFSVIGVQLFKVPPAPCTFTPSPAPLPHPLSQGKLFMCTDISKTTEATCQGEFINYANSDINKPIVR